MTFCSDLFTLCVGDSRAASALGRAPPPTRNQCCPFRCNGDSLPPGFWKSIASLPQAWSPCPHGQKRIHVRSRSVRWRAAAPCWEVKALPGGEFHVWRGCHRDRTLHSAKIFRTVCDSSGPQCSPYTVAPRPFTVWVTTVRPSVPRGALAGGKKPKRLVGNSEQPQIPQGPLLLTALHLPLCCRPVATPRERNILSEAWFLCL